MFHFKMSWRKSKPVVANNINNDVCAIVCGCSCDSVFVKSSKYVRCFYVLVMTLSATSSDCGLHVAS